MYILASIRRRALKHPSYEKMALLLFALLLYPRNLFHCETHLSFKSMTTECKDCKGTGSIILSEKECPDCKGAGKPKSISLDRITEKDLGKLLGGDMKCPTCKGTGKTRVTQVCKTCGGRGKIVTCTMCGTE